MLRVAVIGSGVSGTLAADYLSGSAGIEVHVFDCGLTPHTDQRYVIQQPGVEKTLFGSDWPYWLSFIQNIRREFKGVMALSSHAVGGLTSIWGANCEVPSADEVGALYKVDEGYSESLMFVERRLCVSEVGAKGASRATAPVLEGQLASELERLSFLYGTWRPAKLAVDPAACVKCGDCMSGCESRAIYNAHDHLTRVVRRSSVSYLSSHLLMKISGEPEQRRLEFRHSETGESVIKDGFDLIVLAMGPIEVLPILSPLLKTDIFELEDCQKYYGVSIRCRFKTDPSGVNLTNLVCSPTVNGKKSHLQVYPGSAMLFGMRTSPLTSALRFIANWFVVYVVYCDGSDSSKIRVKLKDSSLLFSSTGKLRSTTRFQVFLAAAFNLLKIGVIPLPMLLRAIPGHSQHFGATSYCDQKTGDFSPVINENLELHGHPDIMIVDATSLRRIPAIPTTFLSLINAVMALRRVSVSKVKR